MNSCQICGVRPAGQYPAGWRCADCTPAVSAGRDEPPPGTGRLDVLAVSEHTRLLDNAADKAEQRGKRRKR